MRQVQTKKVHEHAGFLLALWRGIGQGGKDGHTLAEMGQAQRQLRRITLHMSSVLVVSRWTTADDNIIRRYEKSRSWPAGEGLLKSKLTLLRHECRVNTWRGPSIYAVKSESGAAL